jgi:MFS family permease
LFLNPKNNKTKILTRTVWIVSLVSLFTDVASEMLYPVMPVYLQSIGFSVLLIGILEGLAEATAGLSKGYFGNLSDKLGKRVPFIRFGYSMSAVSKPLMIVLSYPWWIFIARTIDRLGKGIRTSARDALLSDETTPEHKGKVFGFHRSLDTLGAAIGPLIALGFLVMFPGKYKWLFLIAFLPGLVAIALTFLVKDKIKPGIKEVKQRVSFLSYLSYWKTASKSYKKLVAGLLAFTLCNSSDVLLLLALKYHGVSDTGMIGFYIFYNMVYALFSYPMGALADKIGLKTVLFAGLILFAVVYLLIGFVNSYLIFGILFFVYGIYASATEGISKALISNIADKKETATAIGFFSSFASIMALLASSIGGFLWYRFGPQYTFVFSGIGVILVLVYFGIVFPGMKMKSTETV